MILSFLAGAYGAAKDGVVAVGGVIGESAHVLYLIILDCRKMFETLWITIDWHGLRMQNRTPVGVAGCLICAGTHLGTRATHTVRFD